MSEDEEDKDDGGGVVILFHLFEDPQYFAESGGPLYCIAMLIHQVINMLIIISTVALCMETYPEYNPDVPGNDKWAATWHAIEVTCVTCFTIDFLMRFLGAIYVGMFSEFRTDFMNWVDILAILPFYLERMFDNMLDLRFVRVIRLARILRALRSARFGNMGTIITDIVRNSAAALAIPLYFMMLALVLFSSLVYYAEEATEKFGCYAPGIERPETTEQATSLAITEVDKCDDCRICDANGTACIAYDAVKASASYTGTDYAGPSCYIAYWTLYNGHQETLESGVMFESIPDTFWWCIVTFTTVGYGDKSPRTAGGQILGSLTMFMGIFFIAMPLTIVGSSFSNSWEKIKSQDEVEEPVETEGDDNAIGPEVGLKSDIDAHLSRLTELTDDCGRILPQFSDDMGIDLKDKIADLQKAFDTILNE
eukprot:SAG22_NODE_1826_length_3501_cov_254.010876_3_plen_424_part_00